jgi:hypothetical protein
VPAPLSPSRISVFADAPTVLGGCYYNPYQCVIQSALRAGRFESIIPLQRMSWEEIPPTGRNLHTNSRHGPPEPHRNNLALCQMGDLGHLRLCFDHPTKAPEAGVGHCSKVIPAIGWDEPHSAG